MAAPLPTPSGVIHFRCLHDLASLPLYGAAFDVAYTGTAPTTADLEAFAEACNTYYESHLIGLLPEAWSLAEVICTDAAHPTTVEGIYSTPISGTRSGVSALDSKSACVIYFPDKRYRGSRPKGFWPWGVDGDLGSGKTWGADFIAAVNTAFAAFMNELVTTTSGGTSLDRQVSISYIGPPYSIITNPTTGRGRNVGTQKDPPEVITVLSVGLSATVGTQRRRLRAG
jgi:hypothetical protein